ncbi:MAG: hypothetical protein RSD67_05535 [Oscillospiraceae bacterium]
MSRYSKVKENEYICPVCYRGRQGKAKKGQAVKNERRQNTTSG